MRAIERIAVVMPALDEADGIERSLLALRDARARCVVVDGGSTDDTVARARRLGFEVLSGVPRGRASQMNAGAAAFAPGSFDALLFVHADTLLPPGWPAMVVQALSGHRRWGRFDVTLDAPGASLRLVGMMMNLRSRVTGVCTGDQAIFVDAATWAWAGGYEVIPLMEDIEFSTRLKRLVGRPASLRARATVSARRWLRDGVWRTILLMWTLRAQFALGAPPARLHARYHGARGGRA